MEQGTETWQNSLSSESQYEIEERELENFLASLCSLSSSVGETINLANCHYGAAHKSWRNQAHVDRPLPYYKFLAGLIRVMGWSQVLEIGTHWGGSIRTMIRGVSNIENASSTFCTIDTKRINDEAYSTYPDRLIHRITADASSAECLEIVKQIYHGKKLDLLFIDSHHTYECTKLQFDLYTQVLNPAYVLIDDIHLNESMQTLWQELSALFGSRALDVTEYAERGETVGLGLICRQVLSEEDLIPQTGEVAASKKDAAIPHYKLPWSTPKQNALPTIESVDVNAFPCPVDFRSHPPVCVPPTMLNQSELQLLAWMAEKVFSGRGEIVDLGTWLGGSSAALATGFTRNPSTQSHRIYCYDNFKWIPFYDRYDLGLSLNEGDSFLPVFSENMRKWNDVIDVVPADIRKANWLGKPIEILFVDVMKSEETAKIVAENFFPYLIPNASYVIHQDFKFWACPYIIIGSYRLREQLTPALNVADACSLVFYCKAPITAALCTSAFTFENLSQAEIDNAFNWAKNICQNSVSHLVEYIDQAHEISTGYLSTKKWRLS